MKRNRTGKYLLRKFGNETVKAFVPAPLPPIPEIEWSGELQKKHEEAIAAIGRLDGVSSLLPDPEIFLYSYVRKEALLSSQIEGTQSSLADLFSYESGEEVPFDDVKEVSQYVTAITYGIARVQGGFPISNRLIKEVHEKLLAGGRGGNKQPGQFRASQNWIGGTRPGNAVFVPPPHTEIADCMGSLEKFIHDKPTVTPTLIKAALAHVQFETIHPFLDGNGRVGRLLVALILCAEGLLKKPLLYLSLYLKKHRSYYYELLQEVRLTGNWEVWIAFFLEGIIETATNAVDTARALLNIFEEDRKKIQSLGISHQSLLRIHYCFERAPILSQQIITTQTSITPATVNKGLRRLQALGVIKEITGRKRNRLFVYSRYLEELSQETEPIR